ncbi:NAD(P)/FAD-dependent oxidoreductase [Fodinisporobacter ferrooxydans]|uniref:NAD(P)/FAD-dependent oxidoreductase n=1 Tax=Fodinisporobacter ferrooxydans TaxID=2901836 RepID=A0ABY4CLS9_9BACL|nr:NAD(P)/FAD-dependent oxidoreductase [Alicyclobacillaceae bacterium MYW30-H2]
MQQHQVVIIGAGPAGISAAIWSTRLGLSTIVLEKNDKIGGQLVNIRNDLIDYPGFSATTGSKLQQEFQKHLQSTFAKVYLQRQVTRIDDKNQVVHTTAGSIAYQYLIVATGARERRLQVPGAHLLASQPISATRDRELFSGKHVVVVGGGDRACEGACLLADAGAFVTLIHRSKQFRARHEFIQKITHHSHIAIRTQSTVQKIFGTMKIDGVEVGNPDLSIRSEVIPADAVLVRIGTQPNSILLQGIVEMDHEGYCTVDFHGQSSIKSIFCIGDLQVHSNDSSIAVSVGQGMLAAKRISMLIEEEKKRG